jgi:hypothetical protein
VSFRGSRIVELSGVRDRLVAEIVSECGVVKMAEGDPIYRDYQMLGRILNSTIRAEERGWLKRIQEDYDAIAPKAHCDWWKGAPDQLAKAEYSIPRYFELLY